MASVRRRDNSYTVRWREGSRNRRHSFPYTPEGKKAAEAFKAKVELTLATGGFLPEFDSKVLFKDFYMEWLLDREDDLAPRTFNTYRTLLRTHVDPYLGHVPMGQISPKRLEDWKADRLWAGAGRTSIGQTVTLLKQIFGRAYSLEVIQRDPCLALTRPRKQSARQATVPTPLDVERLRGWMLSRKRVGDATLISVLAYAGLRPGEALALRWGDVGDSLIHVYASKTDRHRRVEVNSHLASDLARWRLLSSTEGFVFPRAKDRGRWTDSDFRNWRNRFFYKAAESIGLLTWNPDKGKQGGYEGDFRPYDLRHFRASYLIALGYSVTEVAAQLGHSPEVCLSTYAHVFEDKPEGDPEEWITEARRVA